MRRLHLDRSCASSSDNPLSDKSFLMLSIHLRFGLPLLLFPGTSIPNTLFPTYSSSLLETCPYHFNLYCTTTALCIFLSPRCVSVGLTRYTPCTTTALCIFLSPWCVPVDLTRYTPCTTTALCIFLSPRCVSVDLTRYTPCTTTAVCIFMSPWCVNVDLTRYTPCTALCIFMSPRCVSFELTRSDQGED